MSTNKTTYPFMSVQMFYDIQHFSDSLECDRGPKALEAKFVYEGGHLLHIEYINDTKSLVIEIFE